MYPDSALSAGWLAIIAVVVMLSLAAWLIGVFVAAREPRHLDNAAQTPIPQHPQVIGEAERKAA
jgi:hypothetical protein